MGLLNGGGASLLQSVMRRFYLPGTVYVTTLDYSNGDPVNVETATPAQMQFDTLTERQRAQEGAADSDVRVLVLEPVNTDASLEVSSGPYAGSRYAVMDVARDPVGAVFECRCRRIG